MTLRLSTGLRNAVLDNGSIKDALQGGKILIYTGVQPATADTAPSGTLLATITGASANHTSEVPASGSVTLATGAGGAVTSISVGGVVITDNAVPFNSTLAQTATDLAVEINQAASNPEYTASAAGAVVTLTAKRGAGASPNALGVAGVLTTMTATYAAFAGGVDTVNGLLFGAAASGALPKHPTQNWSGIAAATGTAGWFRFVGPVADSNVLDSTASQIRLDGAISTSGQQLNMSSTAVTAAATQTITAFPITLPTS